MLASLRIKLVNLLGGFGLILFYVLSILISVMPLVFLDFPWWAVILVSFVVNTVPFLGDILNVGIWVWALTVVVHEQLDLWVVLFYIGFACVVLPYSLWIVGFIISMLQKRSEITSETSFTNEGTNKEDFSTVGIASPVENETQKYESSASSSSLSFQTNKTKTGMHWFWALLLTGLVNGLLSTIQSTVESSAAFVNWFVELTLSIDIYYIISVLVSCGILLFSNSCWVWLSRKRYASKTPWFVLWCARLILGGMTGLIQLHAIFNEYPLENYTNAIICYAIMALAYILAILQIVSTRAE